MDKLAETDHFHETHESFYGPGKIIVQKWTLAFNIINNSIILTISNFSSFCSV